MKVQGYRQSIFIDKYFFILTIIMNAFFWLLVLSWIIFVVITKQRWAVDKEIVNVLTEGQDLAIFYIKEARRFINDINKRKRYTEVDQDKMNMTLDNLSTQFNKFRGQQPLIMDSLLETIDSLRLVQKK